MKLINIVLTGGPCAGKTTIIKKLEKHLKTKNIPYTIVSETATELLNGKFDPLKNARNSLLFQKLLLSRQINKEATTQEYMEEAYENEDVGVIIHDRGIMDNKAYLPNPNLFEKMLNQYNLSESLVLDKYNLVIDLITTALCKPEVYNHENEVRYENIEEAIETDRKTTNVWLGHHNLKIVPSYYSLEEETNIILKYVDDLLNNIETKEIVTYPIDEEISDLSIYNSNNSRMLSVVEVELQEKNGYKYTALKRKTNDKNSYLLKTTLTNEDGKNYVNTRAISKKEYYNYVDSYSSLSYKEYKELYFVENFNQFKLKFIDENIILECEKNEYNKELEIPQNLKILENTKRLILKR